MVIKGQTSQYMAINIIPQTLRCIKTNLVFTLFLITARLFCPLRLHGFPLARIPIGQTGGLKRSTRLNYWTSITYEMLWGKKNSMQTMPIKALTNNMSFKERGENA